MNPRELLDALAVAERLKDTTRHCYSSGGRHETVAEHCWMTSLMAFWIQDEFPQVDMNKVIAMCLIHDLGEAFTGDIPVFDKTQADEDREERLLYGWVDTLPEKTRTRMRELYREMSQQETLESRVYKSLDGLEAVVQHNLSPISTWEPNEYELNQTYGWERLRFSQYLTAIREELRKDTVAKIEREKEINREAL